MIFPWKSIKILNCRETGVKILTAICHSVLGCIMLRSSLEGIYEMGLSLQPMYVWSKNITKLGLYLSTAGAAGAAGTSDLRCVMERVDTCYSAQNKGLIFTRVGDHQRSSKHDDWFKKIFGVSSINTVVEVCQFVRVIGGVKYVASI